MRKNYNGTTQNDVVKKVISTENIKLDAILESNKDINLKQDLEKAFIDLKNNIDNSKKGEDGNVVFAESITNISSNSVNNIPNGVNSISSSNKEESTNKESKNKKGHKLIIILIIVIVITLLLGVGVLFILNKNKDTLNANVSSAPDSLITTVDSIQEKINTMYVDNLKTDIKDGYSLKDVDYLREELSYIVNDDIKDASNELDTIELYLNNRNLLNTYSDNSVDIEPEDVGNAYKNIKVNLDRYYVVGLKSTISTRLDNLINERDLFLSLKSEFDSISDISKFEMGIYQSKINSINHTLNKEELQSMYNKLLSDKKLYDAEKALQEANNTAEKEKAKKALADAKKVQEEMSKQLSELKNKLDEIKNNSQVESSTDSSLESSKDDDISSNSILSNGGNENG